MEDCEFSAIDVGRAVACEWWLGLGASSVSFWELLFGMEWSQRFQLVDSVLFTVDWTRTATLTTSTLGAKRKALQETLAPYTQIHLNNSICQPMRMYRVFTKIKLPYFQLGVHRIISCTVSMTAMVNKITIKQKVNNA